MRTAKSILYQLLLLFILGASLIVFLLTSTPGFYILLKVANHFLPGQLTIINASGCLFSDCHFNELRYQDDALELRMLNVQMKAKVSYFLHQNLDIQMLNADKVFITLRPSKQPSTSSPSSVQLPFNLNVNAKINELNLIQGNTIQHLGRLSLQADFTQQSWRISHFAFDLNPINLSGQVLFQPVYPYGLTANVIFKSLPALTQHLKPSINNPSNSINGFLNIRGDYLHYQWEAAFNQPGDFHVQGFLQQGKQLYTQGRWKHVVWRQANKQKIISPEGEFFAQGPLNNINLQIKTALSSPIPTSITVHSVLKEKALQGRGLITLAQGKIISHFSYDPARKRSFSLTINSKDFNLATLQVPLQNLNFNAQIEGNNAQDFQGNMHFNGLYNNHLLSSTWQFAPQKFQSKTEMGTNQMIVSGSGLYHWQAQAKINDPELLHPSLQGLKTSIRVHLNLRNEESGDFLLQIGPGKYHRASEYEQDKSATALNFQGGEFIGQLNKKQLAVKGSLTIDKQKKLGLNLQLPGFKLTDYKSIKKQNVQADLILNVNSLSFLNTLNPEFQKAEGTLKAHLQIQGRVGKPIITGNMQLAKGRLAIPSLGIDLAPIQMTLQSRNRHWDLLGAVYSQGQILHLQGKGEFTPKILGTITIQGDQILVMNTTDYKIRLSPQLLFSFTPNAFTLSGKVLVPQAQLKPESFSQSASLSGDVKIMQKKPAATAKGLNLNTDIQIIMGKEVTLSVQGLTGYLDGAVHLYQKLPGPLQASGELNIRDGEYIAFGQNLSVDDGQLFFTGGSIDNPGITIRATRKFNNAKTSFSGSNRLFDFNASNLSNFNFSQQTTVGIEVSGRLNAPKIKLFSIPATLSQADILSMLLLGRPANQLSQSGGQLLLSAISSMNLDEGPSGLQLLSQLKQNLGFDLNLENDSQYNIETNKLEDKNSFVVGKSISKRLYLSYNLGLGGSDSNVLTLKYLLNKYFSIQVSASESGSGIDLLYTYQKE